MSNILLKQSNGTSGWYLFYSPKLGLCCQPVKDCRLGARTVLIEHIRPDFDAVIDANNSIHIVCQDQSKNILYFLYQNEVWKKRIVLQAKENSDTYAEQFRLFCRNGYLRMTYIMEHKGEKMLCSHELYRENTLPQVLDLLDAECPIYAVTQNQSADTILSYYSKERQALGTLTHIWSQKQWGQFEIVNEHIPCPSDLQIYADPQDTLHLCYKNKTGLYYRKKEAGFENSAWSSESLLMRQQNSFPVHPAFFCSDRQLWLCWTIGTAMYGTVTPLYKNEWGKVREMTGNRRTKGILFLLGDSASALSSPHYGFIVNNQIKLTGNADYFTEKPMQTIQMNGMEIPVRDISQSGSEVIQFAAQSTSESNRGHSLPDREAIEKEKQRIKEILDGQSNGTAVSSSTSSTTPPNSGGMEHDFEDFSAEYFYDLLRREEAQTSSKEKQAPKSQSAPTASPDEMQYTSNAIYRSNNSSAEIADTLSRLTAAIEEFSSALRLLQSFRKSGRVRQIQSRKLAKLHNKFK